MKRCTRCDEIKPFDLFSRNNSRRSGYQSWCKSCYRKWQSANRDLCNADSRRWMDKNRDKHHQSMKIYRQTPTGMAKSRKHAMDRYARVLGAEGTYTDDEWESLKAYYGYRCLRCGRYEPEVKLSAYHIVPLVKGGRNDIGNIQPLCIEINGSRKGNCQNKKGMQTIDYRTRFVGD